MSKQKQKKSMMVLAMFMTFIAMGVFVAGLIRAGELEPTAPPGPTMKTLNEIPPTWSQTLSPASERFELVLNNEAVLDKETGLVWARDANWIATNRPEADHDGTAGDGMVIWEHATMWCRWCIIGNRMGWRLPSVEELTSLMDLSESNPVLPSGYSTFFDNVQSNFYWTSTTSESDTNYAWYVHMGGPVSTYNKSWDLFVWPVRGGSGPILVPHTP